MNNKFDKHPAHINDDLEMPKEKLEETIKAEMEAAENYVQETGDVKLQQATEREIVKEKFDQTIKNQFNLIPQFCFISKLEGVKDISIIRPARPLTNEKQIFANVFYEAENHDGKVVERKFIVVIGEDGRLGGDEIPYELKHLTKEQILDEVIDALQKVRIGDWFVVRGKDGEPLEIIPPADWPALENPGKKRDEEEQGPWNGRAPIDTDRLDWFMSQPARLVGIQPSELVRVEYGKHGRYGIGIPQGSLSDYHAFLFPRGIMFENAVCENIIFYYTFEDRLSEEIIEKFRKRWMTQTEFEQLLDQVGFHQERVKGKPTLNAESKMYAARHRDMNNPQSKQAFYDDLQIFIDQNMA